LQFGSLGCDDSGEGSVNRGNDVAMGEGKNLVGVDIGSSSVKVCQVRDGRRGPSLVRFGFAHLPPQAIVDGQVMDSSVVVETVSKVIRDAKIRERSVAVSVSGQSVIIRKITVPMMTAQELDEQIQWEAEQHIPFDIKDVEVDYQVLKRRPETSQMDLLLVAAKKDHISDYTQLVRNAKLKPVVCDIDAFTVQNLFEFTRGLQDDRTIALINVGASLSSLNIISQGVSSFTREIATGGNTVTEQIQKQMGIPFEQAEAYKCGGKTGDHTPYGIVPQQMMPIIEAATDTIAAEIQRSLDFFVATSGENEISTIYLTGGSSNLPMLVQSVQRRTRVPVETWKPTEKFTIESKTVDPVELELRAPQLAVALGLTLRREREARL
jgi:type IV pilus assembly protein PilM